jgi:hypothetical protein
MASDFSFQIYLKKIDKPSTGGYDFQTILHKEYIAFLNKCIVDYGLITGFKRA